MHLGDKNDFIGPMNKIILSLLAFPFLTHASEIPKKFTELLSYVQEAPDQGESNTCLFVAATGAMELIANKKNDIKNPRPYGPYDLAESYLINATPHLSGNGKSFWEAAVLKFNHGYGIHVNDWPFGAWDDSYESGQPWSYRDWSNLKKITLPNIETVQLFIFGNRWSTNVLNQSEVDEIKKALVKYQSPILVNYNDNDYWHVVLIVGFDDTLPGDCYEITSEECGLSEGSFYVRDSFGMRVEIRDYDWFKIKGNAAFVVKEKNE